jgi:hypothetical protein
MLYLRDGLFTPTGPQELVSLCYHDLGYLCTEYNVVLFKGIKNDLIDIHVWLMVGACVLADI